MRVPRMSTVSLVIVALTLLGCRTAPAPTVRAIDGTWTAVSAQRNGEPDPQVVGNRLTFTGPTFAITRGSQKLYAGTVTTDPWRTPAHIDFEHTEGQAKGVTWRGVYALERDTLTIADNAPDTMKRRPTALAAPAGSGHVVIVFRRGAR